MTYKIYTESSGAGGGGGEDMSQVSETEVMIAYLMLKVKQRDWDGVADAAMDIRRIKSYYPAALAAAGLTHEDVVKLAMGKTDA